MQFILPGALLVLFKFSNISHEGFSKIVFLAALIIGLLLHLNQGGFGTDYQVYLDFFRGKQPVYNGDPAFLWFSKAVSEIDNSGFLGLLIFSSVIHAGYALFIIRWVPGDRLFALALFFLLPIFYINSMNLMRAHFAVAIALSLISQKEKRPVVWGMGGLIAIGFHPVSLITMAIPLLPRFLIRGWVLAFIPGLIAVFLLLIVYERQIADLLNVSYYHKHESDNDSSLMIAFAASILLLSPIYWQKQLYMAKAILVANAATVLFISLALFSDLANFWLRFCQATFPFYIVLVTNIFDCFRPLLFSWLSKLSALIVLAAIMVKSLV